MCSCCPWLVQPRLTCRTPASSWSHNGSSRHIYICMFDFVFVNLGSISQLKKSTNYAIIRDVSLLQAPSPISHIGELGGTKPFLCLGQTSLLFSLLALFTGMFSKWSVYVRWKWQDLSMTSSPRLDPMCFWSVFFRVFQGMVIFSVSGFFQCLCISFFFF